MKPRQLFLGNPGHLGEGEEPAALPLEGVGGAAGGPSPQAPPGSTQASCSRCPQLRSHSSPLGISLGDTVCTSHQAGSQENEWHKDQVRHYFLGLRLSVGLQPGLLT